LIELLTGSQVAESLGVEFPAVKMRLLDLVLRLKDGRILHVEIQTRNSRDIVWRMLEYYWLLCRRFKQPPLQIILYVGRPPLKMSGGLNHSALKYRVQIVDIREVAALPLLESERVEDNLIAVLCRKGAGDRAVRRIIGRLVALDEKERVDRIAQLLILSELRGVGDRIRREVARMPIEIDLEKSPVFGPMILRAQKRGIKLGQERGIQVGEKRGERIGQSLLLQRQLERRFGPLPKWASARLKKVGSATLQRWGLKLLDAKRLEDVVPRSSNGRSSR
jgi:hypothetical protein